MARRDQEVVYVERSDSSVKWLLWGALLGAGVALLYAPSTGEETRRALKRRLRKLRAMTEEKLDELSEQFRGGARPVEQYLDEAFDDGDTDDDDGLDGAEADLPPGREPSAREALEQRLADARARRRAGGAEARR